jgi:hypothetical protein
MVWEAHGPDIDQYHLTGRQTIALQSIEFHEAKREIHVYDQVWGEEILGREPGDDIFLELFLHPAIQRLADIEQLTLPKEYATIPGTADFSRWEHAWGSVVLTRKLLREAQARGRVFDPREKLIMQLRTFISDAGHTAFSHLGDWLRQGYDGPQTSHDEGLKAYLEAVGINDIFRSRNIDPEEVIFPNKQDFVECDPPDLCIDRVDYAVREIIRWVDPGSEHDWRQAFMLDDQNGLILKNQALARRFGLSFGLLATEHWGHPVHRLQVQLFGELVKGAILDVPQLLRGGEDMHPIDRLYTIDSDVLANTRSVGVLNSQLHALLLDIGRAQRRSFAWARETELLRFIRNDVSDTNNFPHPLQPLSWQGEYSGVKPQNVALVEAEKDTTTEGPYSQIIKRFIPAMKPRSVDPLFRRADGSVARLSTEDARYAALAGQYRAIQSQSYEARIYLAPDAAASLQNKLDNVRKEWEEQMAKPRTEASIAALAASLRFVGSLAMGRSPAVRYFPA